VSDVVFVAVIVVAFAMAAALVVGCDRIIGPDPAPTRDADSGETGAA